MNNIAFKKLTTLVFCFLSVGSFSQNYDKSLLEQITPTDPTSASLGKYGVYPVNYSTGLVLRWRGSVTRANTEKEKIQEIVSPFRPSL